MTLPILSYATEIDRTLRGNHTTPDQLASGRIDIPVRKLVIGSIVLGVLYGSFMGLYGGLRASSGGTLQVLATMVKVPLLYLLTLSVTFPSLYVFSTLAGSRMDAVNTLRLLVIAITVNLAVLAGMGPVTGFFVLCTESYVFIKLLNVAWFGLSGIISLAFLDRALGHVFAGGRRALEDSETEALSGPPPTSNRTSRRIFMIWIVVYGFVGAQMGWVLRPFIGSPNLEFQLFRATDSNFFSNLFQSLGDLLS